MLAKNDDQSPNWEVKYLFPLVLFWIPFSISFAFGWHRIDLPSEPLIALIASFLLYRINLFTLLQSKFFRHPVTLVAVAYFLWMAMMVPFSSNWIVSLKYLLVSVAHFWVFYIGFWYYSPKVNRASFKWLDYYATAILMIMLYAWTVHAQFHFRADAAVLTARPFYWDHALYSAALSLLIFPMTVRAIWPSTDWDIKVFGRSYHIFISIVFLLSIYLSFSRAAWISLLVCLMLFLLIQVLSQRVFMILISLGILSWFIIGALFLVLAHPTKGEIDSERRSWTKSPYFEINDVSNLERLNRYRCAWRMFLDRPITGFGAGTFSRAYLTYQRPEELTRISVTAMNVTSEIVHPPGRGGGAHSEYLQTLSELGLPGFLLWLTLVSGSFYTGIKTYYRIKVKHQRLYVVALTLGLTTFFVHGLFNNFLHSDKIAVLFWVMLASLTKQDSNQLNTAKVKSYSQLLP